MASPTSPDRSTPTRSSDGASGAPPRPSLIDALSTGSLPPGTPLSVLGDILEHMKQQNVQQQSLIFEQHRLHRRLGRVALMIAVVAGFVLLNTRCSQQVALRMQHNQKTLGSLEEGLDKVIVLSHRVEKVRAARSCKHTPPPLGTRR